MANVINNVIEINGPLSSKDFYEKNRIIKEKYYSKKINPATHILGTGWTKKQQLSEKRKDKKVEQANNHQFHNRTSKIKEKVFCPQDEIDLEEDFENELKVNQLVLDEIAAEEVPEVLRAAVVGVGPRGVQQVVVVVETADGTEGEASPELTAKVRLAVAPQKVAAVWVVKELPVDIRHNAKIDRTALAKKMSTLLSGAKK